jgi:adenylate cyclase
MAVWIHGSHNVSREEMIQIFRALGALHAMTTELSRQYPVPFELRIGAGLNTGYAVVGNKGTGARPDYTALGDTVNTAFRLESSTKQIEGDVALGETTYHYTSTLLEPNSSVFREHEVELKGYDSVTRAYACSFGDLDEFLSTVS